MSESKFVFCENCKHVFEMYADNHINECPLCDVPNSMPEIPECVANELARRDEIIARLKKDGKRLANAYSYTDSVGETECVYCGEFIGEIHDPACPITLHRALMKELE